MLKASIVLVALMAALPADSAEKKPIYPLLTEEFGRLVKVRARIVSKPTSKKGSSYFLVITEIDKTKMAEAVTIHCLPFDEMKTGKKLLKAAEQDLEYEFIGNEVVAMNGIPDKIRDQVPDFEMPQMHGWSIQHRFVIYDIVNVK